MVHAEIYRTAPFTASYEDDEGYGWEESATYCFHTTGFIGARATAALGVVGAWAMVYQFIPITPPDTDTQVDIHVDLILAHGALSMNPPAFTGTELKWAVGSIENDYSSELDSWWDFDVASDKVLGILGPLIPGPVANAMDAMGYIETYNDLVALEDAWENAQNSGQAEAVDIDFTYWVADHQTAIEVWAGARAQSAGAGGTALASGIVKSITISGIDPPLPVAIEGPDSLLPDHPGRFTFTVPGNNEPVQILVDFDGDAYYEYVSDWVYGNTGVEVDHAFNVLHGTWEQVSAKARERDGLESLSTTEHNVYIWDGVPNKVRNVTATQGAYCGKVVVTWDAAGLAEWYDVGIDGSGTPLAEGLVDTYFEDTTIAPGEERLYYIVAENWHGEAPTSQFKTGYLKEPPEPAYGLNIIATTCELMLDWNADVDPGGSREIEFYTVYRGTSSIFQLADSIAVIPASDLPHFADVPPETRRYFYWVVTANECGSLPPTEYATEVFYGTSPSTPQNVWATDDLCGKIAIDWDDEGHTYKIRRNGEYLDTTNVHPPYDDFDVTPAVVYTYVVEAWDPLCTEAGVAADPVTGVAGAIAVPPDALIASDRKYCNKIRLEWTPVEHAVAYHIYRKHDAGYVFEISDWIATVGGNTTFYDDTEDFAHDYVMRYGVVTETSCDQGSPQDQTAHDDGYKAAWTVGLPNITGITNHAFCGKVLVQWSWVEHPLYYSVWRDGSKIFETTGEQFYDTSPVNDSTHTYQVRAHNACEDGAFSAPETGSASTVPPPPPPNVRATDETVCDQVVITWDPLPHVICYEVYRGPSLLADSVVGNSFIHEPVSFTQGTYEVRARNLCGTGAGATDLGQKGYTRPAPDSVSATQGTSTEGIEIGWSSVGDVTGYEVLRDGEPIAFVTTEHHTDMHVVPGVIYEYTIKSHTKCAASDPSVPASGYLDPDSPMPHFAVDAIDLFQDRFPADGSITGTGRADMAGDILPPDNPSILPGDSVSVTVIDPDTIGTDPTNGGPAVYCYVHVNSPDPNGKTGDNLSDNTDRWPVDGPVPIDGVDWYVVRMDTVFTDPLRANPVSDQFCVDLNDSLFEPGDTVLFFFHAKNVRGRESYWSEFTGHSHHATTVARAPMEFQILPGGGYANGGDILYVNDAGDPGAATIFGWTFRLIGIEQSVDRFDVRDPLKCGGNSPGGSGATAFLDQILPCYRKIIWNTGDERVGLLGDGTGSPEKADDFGCLNSFAESAQQNVGIYLSGNNIVEEWATSYSPSALALKDYISHNLVNDDHVLYGLPPSPLVVDAAGSFFGGSDALFACSKRNDYYEDFDVIQPTDPAVLEMGYETTDGFNGAVVSQTTTNRYGNTVGIVLSGFSFHRIEDDVPAVPQDRVDHLIDIIEWLGNPLDEPIGIADAPPLTNSLSQNHPNPFNPTTTIDFSIRTASRITLRIYNVNGQLVRELLDEPRRPGAYKDVVWDGKNQAGQSVSSGVYFYRLTANGFVATKKMVLLK